MVIYKDITDFSINCLVATLELTATERAAGVLPNYCKSPLFAFPIIEKNRIGIIPAPVEGEWKAAHRAIGCDSTAHHMTQDENPLRAAMIVYLMMKDGDLRG